LEVVCGTAAQPVGSVPEFKSLSRQWAGFDEQLKHQGNSLSSRFENWCVHALNSIVCIIAAHRGVENYAASQLIYAIQKKPGIQTARQRHTLRSAVVRRTVCVSVRQRPLAGHAREADRRAVIVFL
jgi:hypothetical protein